MAFFLRVLINGFAIWLATEIVSGMHIVGADSTADKIWIILVVAVVFGIVNAIIRPIVSFLSIPLYILTLGLFTLVVNALMLWLTSWITGFTDWGLRLDDFWWTAIWGALIVSVVSFVLSLVIPGSRD
ncbi:phage holin family protein [Cellulomonas sp. HZM]|uniref:phage holin family protein n=1 Tax=Cellulomonas sp. HZM TaxID=1454010 RepID=UPI000493437D|nr:phage holin family protein [Cellulomonas sp. HZM]